MTALLSDSAFVQSFISENCKRMAATYAGLTAAADAAGLAYHPAAAAMFLWLDLRKELRAPEWQEERALWQQLVDRGVVLTPGAPCGISVCRRTHCAAAHHLGDLTLCRVVLRGNMLTACAPCVFTGMWAWCRAGLPGCGAGLLPCVLGSGTAAGT